MVDKTDMMGGMAGDELEAADPASLIQQAIDLHQAHMSGAVPPTPESQAELMSLLEQALEALGGGEVSDRDAIAAEVFGAEPTDTGAGQLNRKPSMGGIGGRY